MPLPKNYGTKDAAAYMEMSVDALVSLAAKWLIVRYKLGGHWRYNEDDLDKYYRQQRQQGIATASQLRASPKSAPRVKPQERESMTPEEFRRHFRQLSRMRAEQERKALDNHDKKGGQPKG